MQISSFSSAAFFLLALLIVGCSDPPSGGPSDEPVGRSRLLDGRLEHIREPFAWTFSESRFELASWEGVLPADLTASLLGRRTEAKRIEGEWRIGNEGKFLELSNIRSDGARGKDQVSLKLGTAGHVRVNLGAHQYNVLRKHNSSRG